MHAFLFCFLNKAWNAIGVSICHVKNNQQQTCDAMFSTNYKHLRIQIKERRQTTNDKQNRHFVTKKNIDKSLSEIDWFKLADIYARFFKFPAFFFQIPPFSNRSQPTNHIDTHDTILNNNNNNNDVRNVKR